MVILLAVIGFFTSWILSSIFSGWVLSVLWSWFMVTTFNLPPLSIPAAIGVALTIRFITWQHIEPKEETPSTEVRIKVVLTSVVIGLISLLVGWICTWYM